MMHASAPRSGASRLKTRHLALLLHLHDHGSVLRAAEAANMTQPAASKLLAEMESLLGVSLFERHARGVEPTAFGLTMVRRARAALAEIERAGEEIVALREGRLGKVAIGTVVNPGTTLVPQAVAAMKRAYPGILVEVEMDYSRPLVARLLDGQLDIVIGRIMDPEGAADLEFEPLADEPHAVIVRAGHPLAGRDHVAHADLQDHGWIMPPAASVLRTRLDAVFHQHGLRSPQNLVETASLPVIIHLLRHSDLLAALPTECVAPYLQTAQMQVLPIELDVRMEYFGIIRRRDRAPAPGAAHMLQTLRETARRIYPPLPELRAGA